jgi:hypothetical protein
MRKLLITLIATASISGSAGAMQCPTIFENEDLTTLKCSDGTPFDVWRQDSGVTNIIIARTHKICAASGSVDGNSVMATCY